MGPLQNLGSPSEDLCKSPVLCHHLNRLWYSLMSMIRKKEKRGSGKPRQICSQAQLKREMPQVSKLIFAIQNCSYLKITLSGYWKFSSYIWMLLPKQLFYIMDMKIQEMENWLTRVTIGNNSAANLETSSWTKNSGFVGNSLRTSGEDSWEPSCITFAWLHAKLTTTRSSTQQLEPSCKFSLEETKNPVQCCASKAGQQWSQVHLVSKLPGKAKCDLMFVFSCWKTLGRMEPLLWE